MAVAGCGGGGDVDADEVQQGPGYAGLFSLENTYRTHAANRYFSGRGDVLSEPMKVEFSTSERVLKWVVADANVGGGTAWGVVRNDGRWSTFTVVGDEPLKIRNGSPLEDFEHAPSLIYSEDRGLRLGINAVAEPLDLELAGALSRVENVPDGFTIRGEGLRLYSYSDATERYPHGALGDDIEWGSLVVWSQDAESVVGRYELPADEVFEGLFPLEADLDGDGVGEIVTTVSSAEGGSRLVVFGHGDDRVLRVIAESDSIGTKFRWLHQIAVAPFGPGAEIEIAVVRTPHIGGIVQFYRLVGDRLELVASRAGGYMSHVNGSRNLDQAVAGDFDGDGAVELVVPSRDQGSLIGLRRVGDSVEEVWELELGARLSSNLTAVGTAEGGLVLGAGTEDGFLHIWR